MKRVHQCIEEASAPHDEADWPTHPADVFDAGVAALAYLALFVGAPLLILSLVLPS